MAEWPEAQRRTALRGAGLRAVRTVGRRPPAVGTAGRDADHV